MSRKFPVALILVVLSLLALGLAAQNLMAESTGDAPKIRLQAYTFDPLAGEPELQPNLMAAAPDAGAAIYLLQFRGPVLEAWKAAAEQAGARLYGYVPDYAFIARMDAATAEAVQALPAVRWVGLYQPAYRLAPELLLPQVAVSRAETLTVLTLPDADLDALAAFVDALGGAVLGQSSNSFSGILRASLPVGQVPALARQDGVIWVAPYIAPALLNDVGGGVIMRANQVRQNLGLYGAGQVVAVADSGLDLGSPTNLHQDFQGRLVEAYCLGRTSPCDWSDPDGHGTHVAGSVLASGAASGSNPASHQYTGSYAGVAAEARLVFQSLQAADGSLAGIPDDEGDLIRQAYAGGARVHNNSWGGPTGNVNGAPQYGGYDISSHNVDAATWEQKDILMLFAAGNQGIDADRNGVVDPDSIGSPGTAKNVLTVGASENMRPSLFEFWGDWWPNDFPVNPIAGDMMANNANGMAAFSSRGPTDDFRIKPDLAAPGTFIISTRSRHPSVGNAWGAFNQHYYYQGGTSMATPLTAGAAAVAREWLTTRRGIANPSAALMKAVLINGTTNMHPGQYGDGPAREVPPHSPNIVNGWGRVDLAQSLMPDGGRQVWLKDETTGIGTGGSRTYQLMVGGVVGQAGVAVEVKAEVEVKRLEAVGSPAAVGANILQNGGFESNAAWVTEMMDYTTEAARSGNRSMASFPGFDGYVYQIVTVPADATAATLSYWWRNEDDDVGFDQLQAFVYSSDLSQIIGSGPVHAAADEDWHGQSLNMASILDAIRGQTIAVLFDVIQDDLWPDATFFIDDVALDVQTGAAATATPTATPTQPPGATPTPTPTPPPSGTTGLLRITLAWTDYPGQPLAARALVNDLDLEVIGPGGAIYRGNAGTYVGGQCLRGGQWDACNNVEGVIIPNAPNGMYTVIVRGVNVPQGPQPFAVVAAGVNLREGGGPATATPTPRAGQSQPVYLPLIAR